jgi:endonuclease VIII
VREIVIAFNDTIAARDLHQLAALMADNHNSVDTSGRTVAGKAACVEAWRAFFDAFPDYCNHVESLTVEGSTVRVIGWSTCSTPELSGPARWSADVVDGLTTRWQVDEPAGEAGAEHCP